MKNIFFYCFAGIIISFLSCEFGSDDDKVKESVNFECENDFSPTLQILDSCDDFTTQSLYDSTLNVDQYFCFLKKSEGKPIGIDVSRIGDNWIQCSQLSSLMEYLKDTTSCGEVLNSTKSIGLKSEYASTIREESLKLIYGFIHENYLLEHINSNLEKDLILEAKEIINNCE